MSDQEVLHIFCCISVPVFASSDTKSTRSCTCSTFHRRSRLRYSSEISHWPSVPESYRIHICAHTSEISFSGISPTGKVINVHHRCILPLFLDRFSFAVYFCQRDPFNFSFPLISTNRVVQFQWNIIIVQALQWYYVLIHQHGISSANFNLRTFQCHTSCHDQSTSRDPKITTSLPGIYPSILTRRCAVPAE